MIAEARCPVCGDQALNGHITCGRVECDEGKQRRKRDQPKVYADWTCLRCGKRHASSVLYCGFCSGGKHG